MTLETLKDSNKKVLAQLARDRGIPGWHAMRKDQLIRALAANAAGSKKGNGAAKSPAQSTARHPSLKTKNKDSRSASHERDAKAAGGVSSAKGKPGGVVPAPARTLAPMSPPRTLDHACTKDRIVAMVRDPYWLHVYWELSRSTLARAQAALGPEWHVARPILRVMDVTSEETTNATEQHVRDIDIHGGVTNWYIDVQNPPRSFRVDIGYLSRKGKFYVLARSNVATTQRSGSEVLDQSGKGLHDPRRMLHHFSAGNGNGQSSDDLREILEHQLGRPLNQLSRQSLGTGAFLALGGRKFHFELDAELIVHGSTEPHALVTLQGEPVPVRPDGTFTVRFSLPDSRQIIPAVAASPDGVEERTIVLAVERNTKELEPMIHDGNEL